MRQAAGCACFSCCRLARAWALLPAPAPARATPCTFLSSCIHTLPQPTRPGSHPPARRYMTSYSVNEIFTSVARLGVILSFGSMLITGFLHGDMMAFAGAGIQYWIMQPVFWNILQVGGGGAAVAVGRALVGGRVGGWLLQRSWGLLEGWSGLRLFLV